MNAKAGRRAGAPAAARSPIAPEARPEAVKYVIETVVHQLLRVVADPMAGTITVRQVPPDGAMGESILATWEPHTDGERQ